MLIDLGRQMRSTYREQHSGNSKDGNNNRLLLRSTDGKETLYFEPTKNSCRLEVIHLLRLNALQAFKPSRREEGARR